MSSKIYYPGVPQFKNRIINGDFSVWQRGTSFTISGYAFIYTADRFVFSNGSASAAFTIRKVEDYLGRNFLRIDVDTPPLDIVNEYIGGIVYQFEGQHLYDLAKEGKSITISFIFASNITGEYAVALRNYTDGTINIQSYVSSFNYTSANSYQKVEITIPLNNTWNPDVRNDNNKGFQLFIGFINQGSYVAPNTNTWFDGNYLTTSTAVNWASAAGNFIEIAELQLEEGESATDFEYIPFDIQLLRCMRYYEKTYPLDIPPGSAIGDNTTGLHLNVGGGNSDTTAKTLTWVYQVRKRTTPTIRLYSPAGNPNRCYVYDSVNLVYTEIGAAGKSMNEYMCYINSSNAITGTSINHHWFFVYAEADAEL